MKIAVASGKGGTGKTMLATCLTRYLAQHQPLLLDADVEEPNASLVIECESDTVSNVYRLVPQVDINKCTFCGVCSEVCNFNALIVLSEKVLVMEELCHSCGACHYLCPEQAISETNHLIGQIETYTLDRGGTLSAGRLQVGEAQSPPLIKRVKASEVNTQYTIIDCPPGTTCPMIEAVRDSDYCILVTEPTPFGVHDLKLALEALKKLNIPGGIVINRWRGDDYIINELAARHEVPIIGRIPFNKELAISYSKGDNPLEAVPELEAIMAEILRGGQLA